MHLKYKNYKEQEYFLHKTRTKTGKDKYFFSMKTTGDLVDQIPEGFEIYENPNGQVFLRKCLPALFSEDEKTILNESLKKYSDVKNLKLDIKKDIATVYSPDQDIDELKMVLKLFPGPLSKEKTDRALKKNIHYSPVFQFNLVDQESRTFIAKRFCYLGGIEDWIHIGYPNSLKKLCKKYLKHIGKDSYFELD